MKKIYNSPEMEHIILSASDVIAASFLLLGMDDEANGKFKAINELEI